MGKGNKQITYLGIGLDEVLFPLPTYRTYDLGDWLDRHRDRDRRKQRQTETERNRQAQKETRQKQKNRYQK